jgi:hypothetical protein
MHTCLLCTLLLLLQVSAEGKPPVKLLLVDTEEHEAAVIAEVGKQACTCSCLPRCHKYFRSYAEQHDGSSLSTMLQVACCAVPCCYPLLGVYVSLCAHMLWLCYKCVTFVLPGTAMLQEAKRLHEHHQVPYKEMAVLFRCFQYRGSKAHTRLQVRRGLLEPYSQANTKLQACRTCIRHSVSHCVVHTAQYLKQHCSGCCFCDGLGTLRASS